MTAETGDNTTPSCSTVNVTTTTTVKPPISTTYAAKSSATSLKRARILFESSSHRENPYVPPLSSDRSLDLQRQAIARRIQNLYPIVPQLDGLEGVDEHGTSTPSIIKYLTNNNAVDETKGGNGQLQLYNDPSASTNPTATTTNKATLAITKISSAADPTPATILVKKKGSTTNPRIPTPQWHAPWRLTSVLSSHLGWVRSLTFDPTNDMFASGGADRVIKLFDFAKASVGAEDALKLTLTGHISPVRGLAFSPRHPYLFSCGEDKMVKCWDLETNQVIRHYHGHLSGVFSLKIHPTLDLLVTGGRDACARVWDMRSKQQVHCLTGHDSTVGAILMKSVDPQIITGSYDATIKLWDLAAGKCRTTLTHHQKSVRALAQPSYENTFVSGAADVLKKWTGKEGRFIKNLNGHRAMVNGLALNDDGVLVSGGNDGSIRFWDYESGYCFQKSETIAQPGSLDAENGIFVTEFDQTGTRLLTGEADKTIKIWKQDEDASEVTDPIDLSGWRKQCVAESKMRY
eukprot:CAMPEP_0194355324 /NCGR_PEP_ID=MMETSP0174-20130528/3257_1 /TAXON_ID=216777 /ORGANISM="Proboscia alata, Strain PI-D3" /LENGTH=516 /DNA_ID=CAMNT_0039124559 /DNA_START=15 /DNA_END=1565 /DNA_ORIENTATION=+